MKIQSEGQTLSVTEILELTAANSGVFREEVSLALRGGAAVIEIDLSKTQFVDSSGLGALYFLYRTVEALSGTTLTLLNPPPEIRQLLELTQMQQLFEIVER